MENTRTLHALDEFAKTKPKEIPKELDDYLRHVAASGDPIYQWSLVKFLFRQKLLNVIMDFYESCPMADLPFNANMDAFNFETVKKRLLERYDFFTGVPFTIQRLAELLTSPKKQYNRLDKFLRALEKNIWVVSTREPAARENSDQTNLPNGVMPSVLHDNNGEECQDDQKKQAEISAEDEKGVLPLNNETGILAEDEANSANPIDLVEADTEPPAGPMTADSEPVEDSAPSDVAPIVVESGIIEEPHLETPEEEPTPDINDEGKEIQPDLVLNDEDSIESKEEIKSEEIVVTEEPELQATEVPEEIIEPIIIEPIANEEVVNKVEKVDLKRKIDDVIEGEEELVTCKRLETEPPFTEAEQDPKPISPIEDIAAEIIETVVEGEKEETIETVEAVEVAEIEGTMESSEIEEKVEMIVEEPEQAMDVDESSILSPMVQEDVVELMEASEVSNS